MNPLSKKDLTAGYSDLTDWPSQRATEDSTQPPQGYYAYQYGQQAADDWTGVESSKSGLSLKDIIEYLNKKDPKITNINFANKTLSFQDGSELSFGDAAKQVMELDKSGSAESEEQESNPDAGQGFYDGDKGFDMGKRPQSDQSTWPSDTWMPRGTEEMDAEYWDNIAASLGKPNLSKISKYETAVPRSEAKFRVVIFDGRGVQYFAKQEDANKFYEHALKTELDPCEPEPFTYKNALSKKELNKKANPPSRFWIAPDGTEFPVAGIHPVWIKNNPEILEQYGIKLRDPRDHQDAREKMFDQGWVRISNEPAGTGFQIEVKDITKIPSFVDNFIAKYFTEGDKILVGDAHRGGVTITDPFPSIQDALNKELGWAARAASLKQANSIEEVGGVKVYINPTWEQAKALLSKTRYVELRGVVDPYSNGDLFIWDSTDLTHEMVIRNLGLGVDPYAEDEQADYLSVIGDEAGLRYMFDTQQKVRKALSRRKKKADLSGSTINDILKLIHQDGGATYNLTKGNMAGTDAYAVATHPERSKILEYPLDFEELERYVVENQDLLSDPMNSFGAWVNDGKVYLDIVATVPHRDQAINLGKEHNQIAVFDLKNFKEIPTGGTGEVSKTADENILTQEQQNEIAAKYNCPAMNLALNNYAEAVKRGHDKNRALAYAVESVSNIDKISEKDLVEAINTYLQGLV